MMTNEQCQETAEALLALWSRRGAGHTHAVMNGAANTKCLAVFHNASAARGARDRLAADGQGQETRVASIWQLDSWRGSDVAVVVDHYALQTVIGGLLARVKELEAAQVEAVA